MDLGPSDDPIAYVHHRTGPMGQVYASATFVVIGDHINNRGVYIMNWVTSRFQLNRHNTDKSNP